MIDINSITDIEIDGITQEDYPEFTDAFISAANWYNGEPLTEHELEELNEDGEFVYDSVMENLH